MSDLILFITFLAILWYSFETRKMRKEMEYQRKSEYRPILIVYKIWQGGNEIFQIKNIGRGIAFKVEFVKIVLDTKHDLTFNLSIDAPNVLIPNENKNIIGEAKMKNISLFQSGTQNMAIINPKFSNKNCNVKVVYEDMNKIAWSTETEITSNGPRIINF